MAYQYSTAASFAAYLQSWGHYHSGRPLGPYSHATVLPGPIYISRRPSKHLFVSTENMRWAAEQRKEVVSSWQQFVEAGKPRDAVIDSALIFGRDSGAEPDVRQWAVGKADEPLLYPSPPPSPPPPMPVWPIEHLVKRKRSATPDDDAASDDSGCEVMRSPRSSKRRAVRTESDEDLARRLRLEMNGRRQGSGAR